MARKESELRIGAADSPMPPSLPPFLRPLEPSQTPAETQGFNNALISHASIPGSAHALWWGPGGADDGSSSPPPDVAVLFVPGMHREQPAHG
jgi:hypothetical protein